MTKPKRYKRFSSEFKREAILRASEEGMSVSWDWPSSLCGAAS
jgi:transposase-like protein